MANRKQHNQEAGYIAERANPFAKAFKTVIYLASEQGLDTGTKYAVVCSAHNTFVGETSLPKARVSMKYPASFCDDCKTLAG
jgi:hypothetical protein